MKSRSKLFYKVFISSSSVLFAISFVILIIVILLFPAAYNESIAEQNKYYTQQLLNDAADIESREEMIVLINTYEHHFKISTYIENEQEEIVMFSNNLKHINIPEIEYELALDNLVEILPGAGEKHYSLEQNIVEIDGAKFTIYTLIELDSKSQIIQPFIQMYPVLILLVLIQSLCVAYFITRIIIKPIKLLSQKAHAITNLDFDNKLMWHTNDEYGSLSRDLDDVQVKMKKVISLLEDDAYLRNQIALEEQREKIAILSHELNTPLTVLKMQSELLISTEHEEHKLKYLKRNLIKVDEITNLVDQILRYKQFDEKVKIDITKAVYELTETTYPNLKFDIESLGELIVEVSPTYLSRLLMNIIGNAVKYNYNNQPISIKIDETKLEISNYHSPDFVLEKRKIFEPYFRATTNDEIAGQGLGLYICKRICSLNNFKLDVETNNQVFTASINFLDPKTDDEGDKI